MTSASTWASGPPPDSEPDPESGWVLSGRAPPEPLADPPPLLFAVVLTGAFDTGTVVFRGRMVGLADCFRLSFGFALGELLAVVLAVVLGLAEAETSGAALSAASPAPGVL
ncbi:hypothetical protein [Streptomyces sp. NPDC101166]|uniref:hypothetical protein n=1 Tax=Streptomyces sp. NPDC101166 TaxID=3366120 RepID=UPI00382C4645